MSDQSRLVQRLLKPLARLAETVAEDVADLASGAPALAKVSRVARTARTVEALARSESSATSALRELGSWFPSWRPAAETLLRQAGINIPRQILRDTTLEVSRVLAARRLATLAAAEVAALEDVARGRMLALSRVVDEQLLRAAGRRAARTLGQSSSGTALTTTPVPGGLWVFVTPSTRQDVVLADAFAPAHAGASVPPTRPALPGVARPLWALEDGTLSPVPPETPNVRIDSGLPPEALQQAPTMLLDVLRRAEARRLGTSAGTITGAPIQYVNVPESMRGALGGAVRAVAYRVTESGQRRITITGRTRINPVQLRNARSLRSVSSLFGPDSGIERLHLWGRALGDSVTAGIAYGSRELNSAMGRMEDIISARGLAKMGSTDITVTAIIEMRAVRGTEQPFLRRATYQWTDAGTPYTFSVGLDDITDAVYLRAGLGEGENLLRRTRSLRRP
jgi:hypothetical protein